METGRGGETHREERELPRRASGLSRRRAPDALALIGCSTYLILLCIEHTQHTHSRAGSDTHAGRRHTQKESGDIPVQASTP